jgi:hypothetical protein
MGLREMEIISSFKEMRALSVHVTGRVRYAAHRPCRVEIVSIGGVGVQVRDAFTNIIHSSVVRECPNLGIQEAFVTKYSS